MMDEVAKVKVVLGSAITIHHIELLNNKSISSSNDCLIYCRPSSSSSFYYFIIIFECKKNDE